MSSRKRTSRKKIPESLRINAIANENGITEWKRHGKIKHQANELHELTNRIRKNTSRAIEKYMKLNINTIGELILATDDTCKGRGFTSLHILMRNLGTLTKEIETKEQITRDNFITWHLKCLDKYLTTIKKIHPNLIEQIIKIKNHDNATTPLKHLSRRVEEERIAKGVLNTCLELWSSCSTFVTADDTNNYNVDELRKQFKGYNNNNNNNNTTNINSYYENTATTSTTNTTNEEKCDDDDVNRTIKSTPPLLYTLNKSDETSRPAHDEVLNIVKRVKKNPYLVINSEKETVPESDDTKNTIDKIEAEEENVLTYEEQKELIKKLQNRIIEQQKIIKKLSNNNCNNLKR